MSFLYVCTPYSQYPYGKTAAYEEACRQTALLLSAGLHCLSPIAATHGVALHGDIDPDVSNPMWLELDHAFMDAAHSAVVVMLDGWDQSVGVAHEIDCFERAGKPVFYMLPGRVPDVFLTEPAIPELEQIWTP